MRQLRITKQVTNRSETPSLDKYLHDIGKVPLLTADEEAELARRIKNGDEEALEKLTNSNLRFVVSVQNNIRTKASPFPTSSTRAISDLSRQHIVLTRPRGSSSYPLPYGGYVRPFCRPSPSNPGLYDFR